MGRDWKIVELHFKGKSVLSELNFFLFADLNSEEQSYNIESICKL